MFHSLYRAKSVTRHCQIFEEKGEPKWRVEPEVFAALRLSAERLTIGPSRLTKQQTMLSCLLYMYTHVYNQLGLCQSIVSSMTPDLERGTSQLRLYNHCFVNLMIWVCGMFQIIISVYDSLPSCIKVIRITALRRLGYYGGQFPIFNRKIKRLS